MRTACILNAIVAVILINDTFADDATNQNSLITTYDPAETSQPAQITPRRSHGHITPNYQSGHHSEHKGHTGVKDLIDDKPIKFEDDNYIEQNPEFDDEENSYLNDYRKINRLEGAKIKFEDSTDILEDSDHQEADDGKQSHARQVVFEDNKTAEDDYKYYNLETAERPVDNPIKFESNGKDLNLSTHNANYDRNKAGRISFTDDSNRIQKPVQKMKRKPRRKPTGQSQNNPAQNSPYPLNGYPVYPGGTKPAPGLPGHPLPSYPYRGNPYPSPTYPQAYPGPVSGYGLYPTSGYQGSGESRPPVYPPTYPNPDQGDQGTPGASNLRPNYPYNQGYPVPGYPQAYPGAPNSQYDLQSQGQYRPPGSGIHQQGYPNGYYRPSRRPKSLPERAVSAVAEALTSIALYDDYQCVPRLLCESAGGSTTLPPTLLKATEGLQPLLTLLQAYNGASSSPLFVFGRAAVTGMAAKGNPAVCRQAYPQCPTDPEKLINYLNNHNGGFFRFFGQPSIPQQQQNLEQFYGYLSGQYGLQQTQQNYGLLNQYSYGLQQYPNSNPNNYGNNYRRDLNTYRSANNDSEIEERIQNKPSISALKDDNDFPLVDDVNINSKWLFPEGDTRKERERDIFKIKYPSSHQVHANGNDLKFPDEGSNDRRQNNKQRDYVRKQKYVQSPNRNYYQSYPNNYNYYQTTTPVNNQDYIFDHKHNFYVKVSKPVNTNDVVYVVRGNGDPNHPEIVRVRPGQSV